MAGPVRTKKVFSSSKESLRNHASAMETEYGGDLCDVPIISGSPCQPPKAKHLSGSSRLITLSSSAENCLAHVVGKGSKGNSAFVLLLLINIPG